MIITRKFLDDTGQRSPIARGAMVQAGDKTRIEALKKALISIGACEITQEDAEILNLPIYQRKYSFLASIMTFVLLDKETFERFNPLKNGTALEIAHAKNGLIGLCRKLKENA
jgi:hypothetical protein